MKNGWRQSFHLEPPSGWMNDPNGLCWFRGKYHVYFQYVPEKADGSGGKCWGHYESPDLLRWTFTGAVLKPDRPDDRSGVYSGCGFVRNGLLHLFYTGNVKEKGDYDYITAGRQANVIHVTTPDGVTMSEKETLLRNADYPGFCTCHVRDPKVWEENGTFRMVLGARDRNGEGCVLFYRSNDLERWTYEKNVRSPGFGYMWECPDVIRLGGKRFLSVSPQGMEHGEFTHQNVYSAGYFRDEALRDFREWDYGFDFYAPQTFIAPDGRTLLIGWMGIGDIPYTNPTAVLGWQHCLTVPRELMEKDGIILQNPIRELQQLRKDGRSIQNGDSVSVTLPCDFCLEAEKEFRLDFGDLLTLSRKDGVVTLRFLDEKAGGGRTVRKALCPDGNSVRILADTSSLEIYLNGGEVVLGTRFYPEDTEITVNVSGAGGTVYEMNPMLFEAAP